MLIPPLFEQLPPSLFRPLAGQNGLRYWGLLTRLNEELWGEGVHAPGELVDKVRVVRVIEEHLIHDDPWVDDEGQEPGSPVSVQASNRYAALRDSGWLAERRRGVRPVATMRPIITQFYDALSAFAHRGPEFIGARVHSIHMNLDAVMKLADGAQFHEAANQARSLWSHISNTGVQIYDLMESLQRTTSTREFVDGFFTNYIQKIYIGDYADFRTSNHPLQHRDDIIRFTLRASHEEELHSKLVHWYTHRLAGGDSDRGRRLFERDVARLMRMQLIEEPLHRLDREVRSANQQALMYLDYRTRTPRAMDQLLARASTAVATLDEDHIALPDALPIEPMAPEWLAQPPRPPANDLGSALHRTGPSPEALALDALRLRMLEARTVSPVKLASYLARHLTQGAQVTSDQLAVESILDLSCYLRLLLIATRSQARPEYLKEDPYVRMVPRVRVAFMDGHTENQYLRHRRFVISREGMQ